MTLGSDVSSAASQRRRPDEHSAGGECDQSHLQYELRTAPRGRKALLRRSGHDGRLTDALTGAARIGWGVRRSIHTRAARRYRGDHQHRAGQQLLHQREFALEQFPLDTLRMSGTLRQGADRPRPLPVGTPTTGTSHAPPEPGTTVIGREPTRHVRRRHLRRSHPHPHPQNP